MAWRDKLQHRDFIGERGFGKLISPFQTFEYCQGEGGNTVVCHLEGLQVQCWKNHKKDSIFSYYKGGYRGLVPHPALITRLCILGGVEGD